LVRLKSASPTIVDFNIEEKPFGACGIREAFKGTSKHKEYSYTTWVVKYFLNKSLEDVKTLGQNPEQHTRKSVQLHYLVKNLILFGDTIPYNKVMLGYRRARDEYIMVKKFVSGTFDKDDGTTCGDNKNPHQKGRMFGTLHL